MIEIKEYTTYNEAEILKLYKDVRQIELATDNTPKTVAFYKAMGFKEFSEIGCAAFMKI